jgi:hypothetical protein
VAASMASPQFSWQNEGPRGAVAQLGERQLCKLDVVGSIPISSTTFPKGESPREAFFDKCIRRQNLRFLLSQEKFSR